MFDIFLLLADGATASVRLTIITWAIGVLATFVTASFIAAIPWAMAMHSSIARITTRLDLLQIPEMGVEKDIKENTEKLHELEARIRELEQNK